ncbi:NAD(P)-binding oxidoreductase [Stenotrophomonas sp. NPDC077659]|uniref:NAD(P)-binding oxidoreductase n=1 Tax=Stenotrophomonas sp. NPDC077659 TaxID=3390694 RepID=UPI003D076F68
MTQVFIVGAAGKIGRLLVEQASARGHRVLALHRARGQGADIAALGARPVQGDLLQLDAVALAGLMQGSDVVVFSAGAGGKGGAAMTAAIDGRGLELTVAAAQLAAVPRFLLVSAFPEAGRGTLRSDTFEHYMVVKKRADVHLAGSLLDWVILRPGTLTDEPGRGRVRAGLAIPYGNVARADVAAMLLALIEHPPLRRCIIELTEGDTPVFEALQALSPP